MPGAGRGFPLSSIVRRAFLSRCGQRKRRTYGPRSRHVRPSPRKPGADASKGYSRQTQRRDGNATLQSSWACRGTDCPAARCLWFSPFVVQETVSLGTVGNGSASYARSGVGAATCLPRQTKSVRGAHLASLRVLPSQLLSVLRTHKELPRAGLAPAPCLGVGHTLRQACGAGLLRTRSARHGFLPHPALSMAK